MDNSVKKLEKILETKPIFLSIWNAETKHMFTKFTCSKSTIETIEKGVKYVNNKNTRTDAIDFEQIIVNWVSLSYVLMLYNGNL